MVCPFCSGCVERVREGSHPVWRCKLCGGRAMRVSAALDQKERNVIGLVWRQVLSGSGGGRNCPSCGREMVTCMLADSKSRLELDGCRSCQLIWFDPGEFDHIGSREEKVCPIPEGLIKQLLNETERTEAKKERARILGWIANIVGLLIAPPFRLAYLIVMVVLERILRRSNSN